MRPPTEVPTRSEVFAKTQLYAELSQECSITGEKESSRGDTDSDALSVL
jgi:hypothetical protein